MPFKQFSIGCECCNKKQQPCGCYACNGQIPANDLTLTFDPPYALNEVSLPETTLYYNGPPWNPGGGWSNCLDWTHGNTNGKGNTVCNLCFNVSFSLSCGNPPIFQWGLENAPSCIITSPVDTIFVSYTKDPFEVIYSGIFLSSSTKVTITSSQTSVSSSGYCVNFCAGGCGSGLPGTKIVVSNNSTVVAGGFTGAGGCVNLDIGGPGTYLVEVDPPGYPSLHTSGNLVCPNTYNFNFGCNFTVCVNGCTGNNVGDADITIVEDQTGDTVYEATSNSSGCMYSPCLPLLPGNTYTATIDMDGQTESKPITCGIPISFSVYDICVFGCNGLPLEGAMVTYNGETEETGEDGCTEGFVIGPGLNTVTVKDDPRFAEYPTAGFGGLCDIGLVPVNNYVCCAINCAEPLCKTLQLTDSVLGTCTLTYNGGYPGLESPGDWGGYISFPFQGTCGCPEGNVIVLYYLTCPNVQVPFNELVVWVVGSTLMQPECLCTVGQSLCPGVNIANPAKASLIPVPGWSALSDNCYPFDITFVNDSLQCPLGCGVCNFPQNTPCACAYQGGANGYNAYFTPWGEFRTPVFVTISDEC